MMVFDLVHINSDLEIYVTIDVKVMTMRDRK